MSFILKWLRMDLQAHVGLRPHRDVTLALGYDATYDRVLEAIEETLGAIVTIDDRKTGLIEAGFGIIDSERVRANVVRNAQDDTATQVRIEAFFSARAAIPKTSRYVDALADALEAGIRA